MVEGDSKQISAWLAVDQYEWLRRTAFERRVSQSEVIRGLIADAMAAKEA